MNWLAIQLRRLRQHGLTTRFKALIKKVIHLIARRAINFLNSKPRLRLSLATLAKKLGAFETLRSIYFNPAHLQQASYMLNKLDTSVPVTAQHLSPRARRIYTEIEAAMTKQHQDQR